MDFRSKQVSYPRGTPPSEKRGAVVPLNASLAREPVWQCPSCPIRVSTIQESSASDVIHNNFAPLDRRRRLLARLLDNLPWLVLGGMPPFAVPSMPLPFLSGEVLALVYFSYHVLSYRAWGGHLGHLMLGGRVRDLRTGGRVTLRQAAIRSLYDIAPWGLFVLMSSLVIILLMGAGSLLEPFFSGILDPLVSLAAATFGLEELDSFELVMLTVILNFWIIHWLAMCCVVIPMGIMVIIREDRRHAFDILARVIVVRNLTTT